MEILVILYGKIIFTHIDESRPEMGKDAEVRFADAIQAAIAAGVLHPGNSGDAFCKFGQP